MDQDPSKQQFMFQQMLQNQNLRMGQQLMPGQSQGFNQSPFPYNQQMPNTQPNTQTQLGSLGQMPGNLPLNTLNQLGQQNHSVLMGQHSQYPQSTQMHIPNSGNTQLGRPQVQQSMMNQPTQQPNPALFQGQNPQNFMNLLQNPQHQGSQMQHPNLYNMLHGNQGQPNNQNPQNQLFSQNPQMNQLQSLLSNPSQAAQIQALLKQMNEGNNPMGNVPNQNIPQPQNQGGDPMKPAPLQNLYQGGGAGFQATQQPPNQNPNQASHELSQAMNVPSNQQQSQIGLQHNIHLQNMNQQMSQNQPSGIPNPNLQLLNQGAFTSTQVPPQRNNQLIDQNLNRSNIQQNQQQQNPQPTLSKPQRTNQQPSPQQYNNTQLPQINISSQQQTQLPTQQQNQPKPQTQPPSNPIGTGLAAQHTTMGGADAPTQSTNAGQNANLMSVGNLNKLAEFCATNGEYHSAIEYYLKLTTLDPDNGPAWTALGHCYLLIEDLQKSFNAYQHALYSLDDIKDPQLWYGIGILYEKFESYDHAISALIAVLKMSPNFYQKSEVLYKLGMIFAKTNQIEQAISYFQNSILTNTFTVKRKVDTLLKIGLLYEENRDLAQAQRSFEAALNHDEGNYKIYQHLAWCFFLQGNMTTAQEFAKKADKKNKGHADTHYILGRSQMCLENTKEALENFQQAAYKNPGEAVYWATLAIFYYNNGNFTDAFENIIKATTLNPHMSEIWYNLGILYEKCKQPEEAMIAYSKVLEIETEDVDAQKRMIAIKNPMYQQEQGKSTFNLQMKYPKYQLPNSLTILRKYKKNAKQGEDAMGGQPSQNLAALPQVQGNTGGGQTQGENQYQVQQSQQQQNQSSQNSNNGFNPNFSMNQQQQENQFQTSINQQQFNMNSIQKDTGNQQQFQGQQIKLEEQKEPGFTAQFNMNMEKKESKLQPENIVNKMSEINSILKPAGTIGQNLPLNINQPFQNMQQQYEKVNLNFNQLPFNQQLQPPQPSPQINNYNQQVTQGQNIMHQQQQQQPIMNNPSMGQGVKTNMNQIANNLGMPNLDLHSLSREQLLELLSQNQMVGGGNKPAQHQEDTGRNQQPIMAATSHTSVNQNDENAFGNLTFQSMPSAQMNQSFDQSHQMQKSIPNQSQFMEYKPQQHQIPQPILAHINTMQGSGAQIGQYNEERQTDNQQREEQQEQEQPRESQQDQENDENKQDERSENKEDQGEGDAGQSEKNQEEEE